MTKQHLEKFLSEYFCFFSLSVSFHQYSILIFVLILIFIRRTSGRSLQNFNQSNAVSVVGQESTFTFINMLIKRHVRSFLLQQLLSVIEWIKGQYIVFHDYQGRHGMICTVKGSEVPSFHRVGKSEGANHFAARGFWK